MMKYNSLKNNTKNMADHKTSKDTQNITISLILLGFYPQQKIQRVLAH